MNITQVKNLINMIIPYSLINTIANIPPPYSTLNPDTNSLSLSAWSKGVRFVSAIVITTHHRNSGIFIIINQNPCWNKYIFSILKDPCI